MPTCKSMPPLHSVVDRHWLWWSHLQALSRKYPRWLLCVILVDMDDTRTFQSCCIYYILFMGCAKLLCSHAGNIPAQHVSIHRSSVSCAEHTTSLFLPLDGLPWHPWENRTIARKLVLSSALLTQNFWAVQALGMQTRTETLDLRSSMIFPFQ